MYSAVVFSIELNHDWQINKYNQILIIKSYVSFIKYMETLIELLQVYITAIGTPAEEEVWSSIMFIRGYLAEVKHTRTQLRLLWGNCTGLSEHAGQTAFITG